MNEKLNLQNRRYIGNKYKLLEWIYKNVQNNCRGDSFLDIFAGTGVVAQRFLGSQKKIILNDFLHSNFVIYHAFFCSNNVDFKRIEKIASELTLSATKSTKQNYFDKHFGGKFFSKNDARIIGFIRQRIEKLLLSDEISKPEYYVLLASLIYSTDKISNTVGHYDAYFKNKNIVDKFKYRIIQNVDTTHNEIVVFQDDANKVAEKMSADIVFVDPPYNSRQYSRFYHILENLAEWKKPKLYGTALKPEAVNMSNYSRSSAKDVFTDLIEKLDCRYIAVTYNNTFKSKSSSSQNKITLEQITEILNRKGSTKTFSKSYRYFNSGKTNFDDHKEYLFITKVGL